MGNLSKKIGHQKVQKMANLVTLVARNFEQKNLERLMLKDA